MRVLLDLDGVLADFVRGACALHRVPDPFLKEENLGSYMIQEMIDIYGSRFYDPMGKAFWANLPLTKYAKRIVTILEDYYGSDNICILTSPVRTDGCIDGKMDWIRRHFPQYGRRFLIGPVKDFCASPDSILFDDYAENTANFRAAGGNAFLVPASNNYKYLEHPVEALIHFLGGHRE